MLLASQRPLLRNTVIRPNLPADAIFHLFELLAEVRANYQKYLKYQLQCHPNFFAHDIALGRSDQKIEMCLHEDGLMPRETW